jgi:hypothetical protein
MEMGRGRGRKSQWAETTEGEVKERVKGANFDPGDRLCPGAGLV